MTRFSKSAVGRAALVALVVVLVFSVKVSAKQAYVLAPDGGYLVVDESSLATVKTGNIWEDFKAQDPKSPVIAFASGNMILDARADARSGLAFLLFGSPKAEELKGFLVVGAADLKPVGVILQPMALGPVILLPNPALDRIYVSYLKPVRAAGTGYTQATSVYELSTLKALPRTASQEMQLTPGSCVVGDGSLLYSNHRVYDARTTKEGHSTRFERKPYLDVDCQGGKVLLLSATPEKKTLLTVFDPASNQTIAEIKTDSDFQINQGEWKLAQDGQTVVRDEQKTVPVGDSRMLVRTGQLSFFDVASSAKKSEIRVPDVTEGSGPVGQSASGNYWFYRTPEKLYVVDLGKRSILGNIKTTFDVVGVIWP
ncbi:MAG TPA: hypothetical protein VF532_03940 [Candidatus Angelobacter sp.]